MKFPTIILSLLTIYCASVFADVALDEVSYSNTWGFIFTSSHDAKGHMGIIGPSYRIDGTSAFFGKNATVYATGSKGGTNTQDLSVDAQIFGDWHNDLGYYSAPISTDQVTNMRINEQSFGWSQKKFITNYFYKDFDSPTFSLTSTPASDSSHWTNTSPISVTINNPSDGSGSGISSSSYKLDNGAQIALDITKLNVPLAFSGLTSGIHVVTVSIVDRVANVGTQTISLYVDTTAPPAILGLNLSLTSNSNPSHFDQMNLSWPPLADDYSGLKKYIVYLDPGLGQLNPVEETTQTSSTILVSSRNVQKPYRIAVVGVDTLGNQLLIGDSQVQVSSIFIPVTLNIDNTGPVVDDAQSQSFVVPITLNVTPSYLRNFASFNLQKISSVNSKPLAQELLNPTHFVASNIVDSSGNIKDAVHWKIASDGSGRLQYLDQIPWTSHAGNATFQYSISDMISASSLVDTGNTSGNVTLPNHQGSVSLTILDMNGNEFGSPDFHVYSDGKIQLSMTASDVDGDDWQWEVDSVKQVAGISGLTSYASLSGKTPKLASYLSGLNGYAASNATVTLKVGVNNVCVTWVEAGTFGPFHSAIKSIELQSDGNGGFSIVVTDQYNNSAQGSDGTITVSPGQPLNISASAGAAFYGLTWDFGDASPTENTASVTHSYHQDPHRTTDESTYNLTLSVATVPVTNVPLVVIVKDSSEGELYESETWKADHEVTGKIVVPSSLSLTVSANAKVTFVGGLGAGYQQGIRVNGGSLVVQNGAILKRDDSQSQLWSGIVVDGGAATLDGVSIDKAERGIAAGNGAVVNVSASTITNGEIGVHVLGQATSVRVQNSTIEGNSLDGIKEDDGGRPVVTNTQLKNNFETYYSETSGPLTIDEINALPGNSGNQE